MNGPSVRHNPRKNVAPSGMHANTSSKRLPTPQPAQAHAYRKILLPYRPAATRPYDTHTASLPAEHRPPLTI
jgi:hypothetical protein